MEADGTVIAEELLRHLEAALGPFDESRSVSESSLMGQDGAEFGVVALGSGADTAFTTFGISRHVFGDAVNPVAQELIVPVEDRDFAVNVLSRIGRHVLEHHRAIAAGERHRLPGWSEASVIAGVMAVPDPVVGRFSAVRPQVEFVRLLPITDAEATYAKEHGWRKLDETLAAGGVVLSDLFRDSVI